MYVLLAVGWLLLMGSAVTSDVVTLCTLGM